MPASFLAQPAKRRKAGRDCGYCDVLAGRSLAAILIFFGRARCNFDGLASLRPSE